MIAIATGARANGVAAANVAPIPPPEDRPYAGTIMLEVDASDVTHRVMQVRERIPVQPGALTLLYPKWLPGNHAPTGPIEALAGLQISTRAALPAIARSIDWERDTIDVFAFHLNVPNGVTELELVFQFATPMASEQGRRVMTAEMLGLQWEKTLLYPAGYYVKRITVMPAVKLPAGWTYASGLELAKREGDTLHFHATSLETLIDSPLFAGSNARRIALDAGIGPATYLNVFADRPSQLAASDAQLDAHRRLVREAYTAFGKPHYAHYDFLLALSDSFSGIGLEHQQSSENGVDADYFTEWDSTPAQRDLLPHEFTHSWNGKYRRPADLWTPNYNVPMQNSLLWIYEGMTQFWGTVLAARSGLWSEECARDAIALNAARYGELRKGRAWRDLQDTTNQAIMGYRKLTSYPSWQRGEDYYQEGLLLWLDMDMRLRELTHEKRSLDDFARRFLGGSEPGPSTYNYDDVLQTLNAVATDDWNSRLQSYLVSHDNGAVQSSLRATGWRLTFSGKPTGFIRSLEKSGKVLNLTFSLGLTVKKDTDRIGEVIWDSPAFRAGLTPGMQIVAVGGRAYSETLIKEAIEQALKSTEPIELIVRSDDQFRVLKVEYHGGLRYPRLERVVGEPDRLGALLKSRVGA